MNSGPLSLPEDAVHIWTLPLDSPRLSAGALTSLAPDEFARAQRFHFDRDRRRFVFARAALRRLLAHYLQTSPLALVFQYSAQGKPSLAAPKSDVRFNLSHAEDYALLAFRRGGDVGVDIEKIRPEVETDKLAERFFSTAEREQLRVMPDDARLHGFFRCWTCKEALLKAWGTGMSLPLSSFDVEADPQRSPSLLATRPEADLSRQWALYLVGAPPGYAAALAAEAPSSPPCQFYFPGDEKLLGDTLSF